MHHPWMLLSEAEGQGEGPGVIHCSAISPPQDTEGEKVGKCSLTTLNVFSLFGPWFK